MNASKVTTKLEAAIKAAKLIITHAGQTHNDEYTACAVLRMVGSEAPIERRDPTAQELESPEIIILDIGGVHNGAQLCWDHHQRGREELPECAYSLLLKDLGLWEEMTALLPSLEAWAQLDAIGPFATAKSRGLEWSRIAPFLPPTMEIVLQRWGRDPNGQASQEDMCTYAQSLKEGLEELRALLDRSGEVLKEFRGRKILDLRGRKTRGPAQDAFIRLKHPEVVIFDDDRCQGGTGILRVDDHPDWDWSRVSAKPYCGFCAAFICKVLPGVDPWDVLGDGLKA